jgi:hypothetical protein
MASRRKVIVGISFLFAAVIFFSLLNGSIADRVETAIRILPFVLILGLSVYKLAVWFGYRNDPEKREGVVYSGQIYPKKIRRWLMDEKDNEDKKRVTMSNKE